MRQSRHGVGATARVSSHRAARIGGVSDQTRSRTCDCSGNRCAGRRGGRPRPEREGEPSGAQSANNDAPSRDAAGHPVSSEAARPVRHRPAGAAARRLQPADRHRATHARDRGPLSRGRRAVRHGSCERAARAGRGTVPTCRLRARLPACAVHVHRAAPGVGARPIVAVRYRRARRHFASRCEVRRVLGRGFGMAAEGSGGRTVGRWLRIGTGVRARVSGGRCGALCCGLVARREAGWLSS